MQIEEAHGAALPLVRASLVVMAWKATVLAQVASHTAGHLRWFDLQDLAACAIDVHGDDLQVRGDLLGKLISNSGLGGDVCRFGGSVQALKRFVT